MTFRTLALAVLLWLLPAAARAVTIEDIIALSKAGVSADILIAVIDADRTVFTLTPAEIIRLKRAGVPDPVVVKMLGSPQEFTVEAPPPLIVGVAPPARITSSLAIVPALVPVPVFVAVPVVPVPVVPVPLTYELKRGFGRFINDGWVDGRGFGRFMNAP